MARGRRVDYEGAVHHVMNRGVNRQRVFFGDHDRVAFGRLLSDVHDRFRVETVAYCLMDNHFHLVLRTPEAQLSDAMRHLTANYTKRTNRRVRRDGPLFRGRYRSIVVSTDGYLRSAVRYVHRNPLDLPGVSVPRDYRWSSYRTYLGLRDRPPFVNEDIVLSLFGYDRSELAAFTESSRTWLDFSRTVTFEDVATLVDFAIARDELLHGSDGEPTPSWLSRSIVLLVADVLGDDRVSDAIDRHLAFPNRSARQKSIARARRRLDTDVVTARTLAFVLAELGLSPDGVRHRPGRSVSV